jgi:Tol biopolymer transport system component
VTTVAAPVGTHRGWAGWVAAALFLGTTLFLASRPSTISSSPHSISFPAFPPEKAEFSARTNNTFDVPSFALSPDGHALVFSAATPGARPMLWMRSLDRVDARQLDGTEDAQDPFWSPDGRSIGFFASGTLRQIPAEGGEVKVINQLRGDFRGATWGTRDTILVASGVQGIVSMNAKGGTITPVTVVDASLHENTHRNPSFLPDGLHFLYSVIGSGDQNGVYVGSADGKTKKLLLRALTSAVYAQPGYVLFVDGDRLLGQAFDADRLELKGQSFFIAEHVGRNSSFMSAVSASLTETIAYARPIAQNGRLTWIDRAGNPHDSIGTPEGDYTDFRLSLDETRLAASRVDPKTNAVDIWIRDLARGSNSLVSSGGGVTAAAVWSPDGTRLVYRSNRTGVIDLYERSGAGGGIDRPWEAFRMAPSGLRATDWSRNGRQLLVAADGDLWLFPAGNEAKPQKYIDSPFSEMHGNFSPDGQVVAYTSNESGKFEIYAETVPRSDKRWSVSAGGGYEPRWRADGREIYYLSDDRRLMAVSVGAGPSFGIPKPLFQTHVPPGVTALRTHYVPNRDGQRFLVNVATDTVASPITVVVNWTALVNK